MALAGCLPAYRGYDREKKRAKVELLGSLDQWHEPTKDLLGKFSEAEKVELAAHQATRRAADHARQTQAEVDRLCQKLADARKEAEALRKHTLSDEQKLQIVTAISRAKDSLFGNLA